jgi:hypothetical protein
MQNADLVQMVIEMQSRSLRAALPANYRRLTYFGIFLL